MGELEAKIELLENKVLAAEGNYVALTMTAERINSMINPLLGKLQAAHELMKTAVHLASVSKGLVAKSNSVCLISKMPTLLSF